MNSKDYVSIGKIMNFFGIKGEAKVGISNQNQIKSAKKVLLLDDASKRELDIEKVRFHKNFAIIKFAQINDINELLPYKGQRIFISVQQANSQLDKDEFLVRDIINCTVYNEQNEKIGVVVDIMNNSSTDLLSIKNEIGQTNLVPFVNEFFPVVDIKNKKIIIKPIEGLLS